jgi:hypothetical protein
MFFVFFVSPICSSGAWTHDLVISDQTCQMASCHLLARPKNGGTHTQKPSDGRQLSSHVPAHVSGQNHAHVICSTYGEKQLQLFPCHLTISDPNSFIVPNLIRIIIIEVHTHSSRRSSVQFPTLAFLPPFISHATSPRVAGYPAALQASLALDGTSKSL